MLGKRLGKRAVVTVGLAEDIRDLSHVVEGVKAAFEKERGERSAADPRLDNQIGGLRNSLSPKVVREAPQVPIPQILVEVPQLQVDQGTVDVPTTLYQEKRVVGSRIRVTREFQVADSSKTVVAVDQQGTIDRI